jgi:mRNA interferase HigB
MHWYRVAKLAAWRNLFEVRADFPHADAVGLFTVFNVGGNKLEYSKEKWKP